MKQYRHVNIVPPRPLCPRPPYLYPAFHQGAWPNIWYGAAVARWNTLASVFIADSGRKSLTCKLSAHVLLPHHRPFLPHMQSRAAAHWPHRRPMSDRLNFFHNFNTTTHNNRPQQHLSSLSILQQHYYHQRHPSTGITDQSAAISGQFLHPTLTFSRYHTNFGLIFAARHNGRQFSRAPAIWARLRRERYTNGRLRAAERGARGF